MPGFDAHLSRLNSDLRGTIRDRISAAAALSKDGKAIGMDWWAAPEKHAPKRPDTRINVMGQDEGGTQIYVRFRPKTHGVKGVSWPRTKRTPLLHLTEEQLLSLQRFVWHPNDPEAPLVILARCAK